MLVRCFVRHRLQPNSHSHTNQPILIHDPSNIVSDSIANPTSSFAVVAHRRHHRLHRRKIRLGCCRAKAPSHIASISPLFRVLRATSSSSCISRSRTPRALIPASPKKHTHTHITAVAPRLGFSSSSPHPLTPENTKSNGV